MAESGRSAISICIQGYWDEAGNPSLIILIGLNLASSKSEVRSARSHWSWPHGTVALHIAQGRNKTPKPIVTALLPKAEATISQLTREEWRKHWRRIISEEKQRSAVWGTEFIQFLAALYYWINSAPQAAATNIAFSSVSTYPSSMEESQSQTGSCLPKMETFKI